MRRILIALIAVCAVFFVATPAQADGDVDDFTFSSMHVDYTLTRAEDGTSRLRTVETLVAQFPEIDQNRGIRRAIPESFDGLPMAPSIVSVTDGDGVARDYEEDSEDGFLIVTIAADDYVHGSQTYVITYDEQYVTRYYADTGVDEFYRDVNGTGWAQPFGEVSMTLTVDPSLALTGALACYQGAAGSTDRCDISQDGSVVTAASGPLEPGGNMTVSVAFPADTFARPDTSYFGNGASWAQVGAGALALAALGGAVFARSRYMQDEPGHSTVVAQYEPPVGYDALASAVLLEKPNGPTAEILEQAVRGSLRLVERPKRFGKPMLVAQLVDPARAGDGDGRDMLVALFGVGAPIGAEYAFDGQDTAFASRVDSIVTSMKQAVAAAGVRRRVPIAARLVPILTVVIATVVAFVLAASFLDGTAGLGTAIIIALVLVVIAVAVVIVVSKRPFTRAGAEVRDHLRGLELFMRWAEADRIRMLQSRSGAVDASGLLHLYEPLLPYAVIFGLEKEWSGLVANYYEQSGSAPVWFVGTQGFSSSSLPAALVGATGAMSSASSSSSGGSSGGGSSGGGGGGGGGGGV